VTLGSIQPLTAMSTSGISWLGVGGGGSGGESGPVRRADDINHPHVSIAWKLWEPPIQALNGTALPFTFMAYCLNKFGYFQDHKLHI
jgi:hypothetical protein